jgi:hypothetical protein
MHTALVRTIIQNSAETHIRNDAIGSSAEPVLARQTFSVPSALHVRSDISSEIERGLHSVSAGFFFQSDYFVLSTRNETKHVEGVT